VKPLKPDSQASDLKCLIALECVRVGQHVVVLLIVTWLQAR
jgi:hypothetical protein